VSSLHVVYSVTDSAASLAPVHSTAQHITSHTARTNVHTYKIRQPTIDNRQIRHIRHTPRRRRRQRLFVHFYIFYIFHTHQTHNKRHRIDIAHQRKICIILKLTVITPIMYILHKIQYYFPKILLTTKNPTHSLRDGQFFDNLGQNHFQGDNIIGNYRNGGGPPLWTR